MTLERRRRVIYPRRSGHSSSLTPARVFPSTGSRVARRWRGGRDVPRACEDAMRRLPDVVPVRDSKRPAGPVLTVTPHDWRVFIRVVKANALELK